jgi:YjbE family integral membrane protein
MESLLPFFLSVVQILVIDLVLSGDNAVVIAMAAHRLPEKQRRVAILCGAAGAIVLRILFTWVLAKLLGIPFLRLGGGLVLIWIAIKLLMEESDSEHHVREGGNLLHAIWIIIMADFVMSLDNMLAVGGASEGNASLILFGLILSISIIMTCSALVARLMNRFPVLVTIGAIVLAWTAAEMILNDSKVAESLVSAKQLCINSGWHEDFGGASPGKAGQLLHQQHAATDWWVAAQDRIAHHHYLSWVIIAAVILFVLAVPRLMKSSRRKPEASGVELAEEHEQLKTPPAAPHEDAQ